jgi:hypothetical protein
MLVISRPLAPTCGAGARHTSAAHPAAALRARQPLNRRMPRSLRALGPDEGEGAPSSAQAAPSDAVDVAAGAPAAAALTAARPAGAGAADDANPFLDPLVRSLFLGVGAGIVCEAMHVFLQVRCLSWRRGSAVEALRALRGAGQTSAR